MRGQYHILYQIFVCIPVPQDEEAGSPMHLPFHVPPHPGHDARVSVMHVGQEKSGPCMGGIFPVIITHGGEHAVMQSCMAEYSLGTSSYAVTTGIGQEMQSCMGGIRGHAGQGWVSLTHRSAGAGRWSQRAAACPRRWRVRFPT